MELVLDKWQRDVLETKGNICLCSGRQVGKSTVISMDAGEYAMKNPNKTIMVISAVERQALLLFEKILSHIHEKNKNIIKTGKDKPTKHTLRLKNGSTIHCLPTGLSGYGIRGYTIDRLYADEAAFIPEDVWAAVTPMLATTGGDIILLSTPFGREGYFYRCSKDDTFTYFHVNTEEVAQSRPEVMKERMLQFLKGERQRMTKIQYAQEYLGEFIEELQQFFPDKLIVKCMILSRGTSSSPTISFSRNYFLGVDIARLGKDESTFEVIEKMPGGELYHRENQVTVKELTTMTTRKILQMDLLYKFNQIYVDDGGLGAGVFDQLIENTQTRRKTKAINNLRKAIEYTGEKWGSDPRKKKLMKEELYNNLLNLMEQGKIKLLDDPEIFQSLKSVQYEYTRDDVGVAKIKIFGTYTHIAEGLIRAAWCSRGKIKKLWIDYI